jgi:mRNA interferase RelE/StbE
MSYKVILKPSVIKELKTIPKRDQRRIAIAIELLSENPYPNNSKKLVGSEQDYRVRVGNWRIIYEVQNNKLVVYVLRVAHRKDVYRNL